jgi:Trypsin-co-occurring domain 1
MSRDSIRIPVQSAGGIVLFAEVSPLGGDENVSAHIPSLDEVGVTIAAIADQLSGTLKRLAPTTATIEFALELGLESGKLTAILVQGSAKANVKVALEWKAPSAE